MCVHDRSARWLVHPCIMRRTDAACQYLSAEVGRFIRSVGCPVMLASIPVTISRLTSGVPILFF